MGDRNGDRVCIVFSNRCILRVVTMKTPEGRVKDEIRKWLKEQGAYVFSPVQMGIGSRTLDLLVCWRGRFVAIEVKRPGKRAMKLQQHIIDEIVKSGGYAFCTDNLERAKVELKHTATERP
jgi:Holliday junction resolvase